VIATGRRVMKLDSELLGDLFMGCSRAGSR
jgi:hypothetical protein